MDHAYAQALWKMLGKGTEPDAAVRALRETLARRGRTALLPGIARALRRIAARESRRNAVTITVARAADASGAKAAAARALAEIGAGPHDVEVRLDDTLIGGWRIEGRGRLVDASFKTLLSAMYNRATGRA